MRDARDFGRLLVAAILGALVVSVLPAVAAAVGDPLALGEVNKIDERTDLKGDAKGANLQIKNTGNAGALTAKADKNTLKAKATNGPVAINATADRVAVKIKVDPGQAPLKVNASAGTATNFSADLLDGMDSNAFLQVAAHAGGDQLEQVTPTDEVVRSVSLTAPSDGVVIANSVAVAGEATAGDDVRCSITTGATLDDAFLQIRQSGGDGSGGLGQLAGTRGFDVTAGQELTVNLVCDHDGVSGFSTIFDSALTAIFIPNG